MKDSLGIICSSLCIVHYVATPVILSLLATILTTAFIHYMFIVNPVEIRVKTFYASKA